MQIDDFESDMIYDIYIYIYVTLGALAFPVAMLKTQYDPYLSCYRVQEASIASHSLSNKTD